jgi:hypothetical protein
MALRIPLVASESFYSFSTQLLGITYLFEVKWNGRHGMWYFDLLDADEDLISANNAVALGSSPVRKSTDPRRPRGLFFVRDLSSTGVDASYDDIGVRVVLEFYTFAEING